MTPRRVKAPAAAAGLSLHGRMAARRRVAYAAVMHAGPPDLPDLAPLPPDIRAVVERQMAALAAERAARLHLESENEERRRTTPGSSTSSASLSHGRRSEKLDPDQLEFVWKSIEVGVGEALEAEEARAAARGRQKSAARPTPRTRSLPAALPRIERVIEPDGIRCPCGCGDMVRIGEDRLERLDTSCRRSSGVIVMIHRRYACPKSRAGIVQAKAPAHFLEGALPGLRRCSPMSSSRSSLSTRRFTGRRRSSRATGSLSTARRSPTGWGVPYISPRWWSTGWPRT